jgi:hypothetical protein
VAESFENNMKNIEIKVAREGSNVESERWQKLEVANKQACRPM